MSESETSPPAPETPAPPPETTPPAQETPAPAAAAPARPYQAPARVSKLGFLFFAGALLFLVGLFWRIVEEETGLTTSAWIFLSIVAMLVPFAWHLPDIFRSAASRRGGAFAMVAVTTALAFVVAAFVGWATTGERKARLPSFDFTKSGRYTLSDESVKLLDKVEGTIYATYLTHGGFEPGLRAEALEQLRTFESSSPRLRFAEVDAVRKPEVAARILREQGVQSTSSGEDTDVIVLTYAEPGREVAPGKQKEIKVESWAFHKTSSTGAEKWLGESVIADAIFELVFQRYKAYATGGHGERSLTDEFRELRGVLTTQNVEVAAQPLHLSSNPSVPDDCELLLVLGPTAPFSAEEAEAVTRWLDKGRTLVLTVDVRDERSSTGLDALLEKRFGVTTRTNFEVFAPEMGRVNVNGRDMQVVSGRMTNQFAVYGDAYADHPAARALRSRAGLATFFFKSTFVEIDDKPPEGATPEAVCNAPERAESGMTPVALRHDPSRKDYSTVQDGVDKDRGKFPLVVTSVRKPADPAGREARLVVSGDTDVFTDGLIGRSPANLDLLRGLVQWGLRREGLVAVSDRTLENPYVSPTPYQQRFAFYWPMAVIFLPLVFGGMVWWSRRR